MRRQTKYGLIICLLLIFLILHGCGGPPYPGGNETNPSPTPTLSPTPRGNPVTIVFPDYLEGLFPGELIDYIYLYGDFNGWHDMTYLLKDPDTGKYTVTVSAISGDKYYFAIHFKNHLGDPYYGNLAPTGSYPIEAGIADSAGSYTITLNKQLYDTFLGGTGNPFIEMNTDTNVTFAMTQQPNGDWTVTISGANVPVYSQDGTRPLDYVIRRDDKLKVIGRAIGSEAVLTIP